METQHDPYFLAIRDELSFTHAAQECGIKQPSLSETIKRIGGERSFCTLLSCPTDFRWLQLRPICIQIRELLEKCMRDVNLVRKRRAFY